MHKALQINVYKLRPPFTHSHKTQGIQTVTAYHPHIHKFLYTINKPPTHHFSFSLFPYFSQAPQTIARNITSEKLSWPLVTSKQLICDICHERQSERKEMNNDRSGSVEIRIVEVFEADNWSFWRLVHERRLVYPPPRAPWNAGQTLCARCTFSSVRLTIGIDTIFKSLQLATLE